MMGSGNVGHDLHEIRIKFQRVGHHIRTVGSVEETLRHGGLATMLLRSGKNGLPIDPTSQ